MEPRQLGATYVGDDRTAFLVWAPDATAVEVVLDGRDPVGLNRVEDGYHQGVVEGVRPGSTYRYRLHREDADPVDRPDPASRHQPEGVHGPSEVVDPTAFAWDDAGWSIGPLHEQVIYELHVGTFTPEGTFDAIVERLGELRDLGVTAIQLMPVWQFPGERNWGYDGVLPYAVQHSYGGPEGLRRLVAAAHDLGLGVLLDVVYNHYGPEGNHLRDFGPYFTDTYDTPWGEAVNVDDADSDEVRRFILDNARRWIGEFHLDGLRLDAVHAVIDRSAIHWLEELADAVHTVADQQGRRALVIAESDLQDPRLVRPADAGGYGLDGQWLDDIHHTVRVAVTGDRSGYYTDYTGLPELARAARDRYVLARRYSAYRGRTVGRPAPDVPYHRFVVCTQNHDQVGNRMVGDRLDDLVDPPRARFASAAILLLPFTPMLFMGEEYAETAPFQYFVSHTEPELVEAVRRGRRREFAAFAWQGEAPDPQAPATFERSRLDWSLRGEDEHARRLAMTRELLRLRREVAAVADPEAGELEATVVADDLVWLRRPRQGHAAVPRGGAAHASPEPGIAPAVTVLNGSDEGRELALPLAGRWRVAFDTTDTRWTGDAAGTPTTVTRAGDELVLALAPWSATLLVPDPQEHR